MCNGPALVIGRYHGNKYSKKAPLTMVLQGKRIHVEIPLTQEQDARIDALQDERREQENQAQEKAQQQKPQAPMTPENAHEMCCKSVEDAIEWLRDYRMKEFMGRAGCEFTPGSINRIQQSFKSLRRAFSDGC
jgi:hypothetical protein